MPYKRVYRKRKSTKPKRKTNRRGRLPAKRMVANYASVTETWTQFSVAGTCGDLKVQGLLGNGATYRAPKVAQAYQEYRITGLEIRIVPQKDTFLSAGSDSVPSLYWMNDPKNALLNNMSETDFQTLGCKPIRVDDKIIRRTLKPSVIVVASPQGTGFPSISMRSPWLSTNANFTPVTTWNASTVTHYGAKWLITNTATGATPYELQVRCTYQFRRPLLGQNASVNAPEPVVQA